MKYLTWRSRLPAHRAGMKQCSYGHQFWLVHNTVSTQNRAEKGFTDSCYPRYVRTRPVGAPVWTRVPEVRLRPEVWALHMVFFGDIQADISQTSASEETLVWTRKRGIVGRNGILPRLLLLGGLDNSSSRTRLFLKPEFSKTIIARVFLTSNLHQSHLSSRLLDLSISIVASKLWNQVLGSKNSQIFSCCQISSI